jgi:NADH-quinone oxidoreductase subunit L
MKQLIWLAYLPITHREFFQATMFLIPLFPLLGFLLNGLFGRRMDKKASGAVAVFASLASFVWAFLCVQSLENIPGLSGEPVANTRNALHVVYGTWLDIGGFSCNFGLYLDQLSSVMILVVTGIGTLIHLYSMGYMAHDNSLWRFFAYLNLFLFAMILLVLGDNLILMFVGWEGVGLCSYLLIGFWYEDGKNAAAGMKAFVVNRIGDLGFILGIFTLIALLGTVNYVAPTQAKVIPQAHINTDSKDGFVDLPSKPGLLDYGDAFRMLSSGQLVSQNAEGAEHAGAKKEHAAEGHEAKKPVRELRLTAGQAAPYNSNLDLSNTTAAKLWPGQSVHVILTLACFLLFVGAMGKSAQIPLYVWLPDAMAGPTPVSALIHAATMVTAGVYMICRLFGLFSVSPEVLQMIAVIGGCTALLSALIGLTQLDIKKVLAYSTVSQLGYMFLGLGVGAFSLGIYHVFTHAFFKALLFLGAGSVIHAMSGEQDMRLMGGLRKKLPITFITMLIGALALAGMPFLAGWFSKDKILMSVLVRYHETHDFTFLVLYIFGMVAAFCTAFYTFRLIFLTFFGESRASAEVQSHVHESPPVMYLPLIVLAVFSVLAGFMWDAAFTSNAERGLGIRNLIDLTGSHDHEHHLNLVLTFVAFMAGLLLALAMYVKGRRVPNPDGSKNFLYRLSLNKFYVDETYNALIVMPFVIGAEIAHWVIEMLFIDLLVTGFGYAVAFCSGSLRRIQSGLLNAYAFFILSGTVAVLLYLLRRG